MMQLQQLLYSAKFLRAVDSAHFAVSLQNVKIISAKMNRRLVKWLNYACNLQFYFCDIKF